MVDAINPNNPLHSALNLDFTPTFIPIHEPEAPQDSVSAAALVEEGPVFDGLLTGRLTIGTYTDRVQLPKIGHRQRLFDNDRQLSDAHSRMLRINADFAIGIGGIQQGVTDIHTDHVDIITKENTDIANLNESTSDYNTQITDHNVPLVGNFGTYTTVQTLTPLFLNNTIPQSVYQTAVNFAITSGQTTATQTLLLGTNLFTTSQITQQQYVDIFITPMMASDNTAISALNVGTDLYNNNHISQTQYTNIFANVYNSYVAGRNGDIQDAIDAYHEGVGVYNTEIGLNNAAADPINSAAATYNIPPIPDQIAATTQATSLLPVVTIPLPSKPLPIVQDTRVLIAQTASLPPPLELTGFLNTYFKPVYDTLFAGLTTTNRRIDYNVAQLDFDRTFRRGKNIGTSNTFIDRHPTERGGSPAFARGGGSVGSALVSSESAPHLEAILSNSLLGANQTQFEVEVTNDLLSNVNNFTLLTMQNLGLLSTRPASQAINLDGTPENAFFSFQVASGVSVAAQVADIVSSGQIRDSVQKLVEDEIGGTVSQEKLNTIVDQLTASVNIALLEFAVTTASISLQAPGLSTHLAGNVSGLGDNPVGGAPLTPKQVLTDSTRRAFFTTTLAGILGGTDAQQIIDTAVTAVLADGKAKNSAQLKNALVKELTAQGVDQATAKHLADQAGIIVALEASGSRILHTDLLEQVSTINLLAQQLEQTQGLNKDAATAAATLAITEVLKNKDISSDAQFQAALQIQLTKQGFSGSSTIAEDVVTGVAAASTPASPLEDAEPTTRLRRNRLRAQLARHISQLLANPLGPDAARRHANRTVDILVGAPGSQTSILSLLDQNVALLSQSTRGKADEALRRSLRELVSPNIDAFVMHNKILDPANTFFLTAMTSTRLTGVQQPKNYIRYLEFYA